MHRRRLTTFASVPAAETMPPAWPCWTRSRGPTQRACSQPGPSRLSSPSARHSSVCCCSGDSACHSAAYARHKESYLNTAQSCEGEGAVFVSMVMETTGTWDKGAATVLQHIARAVASRVHAALVQELCVVARLRSHEETIGLVSNVAGGPSITFGSVKLLLLRPVGMHGAGVLAGRRRLVRVSGLALRPTMFSALMSVWTHAASLLHHWVSDAGRASCLKGSVVRCFRSSFGIALRSRRGLVLLPLSQQCQSMLVSFSRCPKRVVSQAQFKFEDCEATSAQNLPLTAVRCRCRQLHDPFAACPRSGILRPRGGPLERAAARICREAGATVALNLRLRNLNVDVARQDERRIEVIAVAHSSRSTPRWSPPLTLARFPEGRRTHSRGRTFTCTQGPARRRNAPELRPSARCKLVVLALELGGRCSAEAATFVCLLARLRARALPASSLGAGISARPRLRS